MVFPKEFEGESLAILWLKVVIPEALNRPNWILHVTACLAGSHEIEIPSGRRTS